MVREEGVGEKGGHLEKLYNLLVKSISRGSVMCPATAFLHQRPACELPGNGIQLPIKICHFILLTPEKSPQKSYYNSAEFVFRNSKCGAILSSAIAMVFEIT
jgi:hypothetical protein